MIKQLSLYYLFAILVSGVLIFYGCSEDDDGGMTPDNDAITMMRLILEDDQGNNNTYQYSVDGSGNVTVDDIQLMPNRTYMYDIEFWDESDPMNPINRTQEIRNAADIYLVCFSTTLGSPIQTVTITDPDINGDPLGLTGEIEIGDPGTSTLQIMLKQDPDKSSSQPCATGTVSFNGTFDVMVEQTAGPAMVTEIEMNFSDGNSTESFIWTDQDGPGGIDAVADDIELPTCTEFDLDISFKDITQSPAVDINQNIGVNLPGYIVLLQLDGMSQETQTMVTDLDGNGQPVGLEWMFKSGAKGSGTLTVTLKKDANKTDPENTGTVEAEAQYNLTFVNSLENITFVQLVFTDDSNNEIIVSKGDPDGPGGQAPVNETAMLDAQSSYTMDLRLFDTDQSPVVEVTDKIACEGADHYVIFLNTGIGLNIARADLDEDSLPIGLKNTIQTFAPANGQVRITLKDNIDKFNPFTTGDIEYEGTFNLSAQ